MPAYSPQAIEVAVWNAFDERVLETNDIICLPDPEQRNHVVVLADGNDFVNEFADEIHMHMDMIQEGEFDSIDDAAHAFVEKFTKDWLLYGGADYQVVAAKKVAKNIHDEFDIMKFFAILEQRYDNSGSAQ